MPPANAASSDWLLDVGRPRPEIQGDVTPAYWYTENMKYYFLIFGRSPRFSYARNAYLSTEGNVLRGLLQAD
jgi:mannosyl-oligosaccharide alpha-1,2-mannosidase